jgi:1-acyl-sn-glycerol-3-phosphate acyltransferase
MLSVSFLRAAFTVLFIAVVTILGGLLGLASRLVDSSGDLVLDLARAWSRWVTSFAGVKIVVENRANLVPEQPYVFMANHASSLDIWAVFVAIPRRIRLIAKKQLGRIPLFGWVMWAGRFIFIDRQNGVAARRSIDEAGQRIHDGRLSCSFPRARARAMERWDRSRRAAFTLRSRLGFPSCRWRCGGRASSCQREASCCAAGP